MTLVLTSPHDAFPDHPLLEGDHLVGMHGDCDLRLEHPTVSRRHALVRVGPDGAEIVDLGSKNGTRIGGRAIDEPARLEAGQRMSFGTLEARVEAVDAGDLETAVAIASSPSPDAPTDGADAGTTAALGSLRAFTLEHLPAVLRAIDERAGLVRIAQSLGQALFVALPTREVMIAAHDRDDEGILFLARTAAPGEEEGLTSVPPDARAESSDGRTSVRVAFLHPAQARSYAPLVQSAVRLLRMAAPPEDRGRPLSAPEAAALPEPATVVPAVRSIYRDAATVALGDISVLITGASGTGKEVLARYIHAASARSQRPLVTLNCAALPRDLLEAELFGIERGVATGVEARPGKFELADGGTLFLDEIADMAPATQAKILRVLQEREVYRLGGRAPRSADVRIVAATNRDVDALRERDAFRVDLYHRIADWRVDLPSLEARAADIPNLAAFFLERAAARRGQAVAGISRRALEALEAYAWPGNIRQLEREMARAALFLGTGRLLQSTHLASEIRRPGTRSGSTLKARLETAERAVLEQALGHHPSLSEAARALAISRSTLYRRIKQLGIDHQEAAKEGKPAARQAGEPST